MYQAGAGTSGTGRRGLGLSVLSGREQVRMPGSVKKAVTKASIAVEGLSLALACDDHD